MQGIEARDMSQAVMDDVRGYMGKDRRPGLDTTLQISFLNLVSTVTFCPINVPSSPFQASSSRYLSEVKLISVISPA